MISVDEALAHIRGAFHPLAAETVSLGDALGRVLAEEVTARVTQPPVDVSAMDGYAVRAQDVAVVPATLRVVGEAPAGGAHAGIVAAGQAVRIFTGGPVPAGADTIIIQEHTEAAPDRALVIVRRSASQGRHIRRAGNDFRAGTIGLARGHRIGPRDIALAAGMNVPWVRVVRRPRVAILATGDELVMPGEPRDGNQIISTNSLGLAAAVSSFGGVAIDLGIAPDDRDALIRMADGATGADLLVTIGGASVGDRDLVRAALGEVGFTLDFWKIAIRPGKPLIFGRIGATPLLGLPGNPVSALVCTALFVRAAMEAMFGLPASPRESQTARLAADIPANDEREDFMRARREITADGGERVRVFPVQDSAMLSVLAAADCLVIRPPHAPAAAAGDMVPILPLAAPLFRL
ncbi:MAG: gephyrin-like molybdotransferase Glp [Alphaproteobacteria bacterium]